MFVSSVQRVLSDFPHLRQPRCELRALPPQQIFGSVRTVLSGLQETVGRSSRGEKKLLPVNSEPRGKLTCTARAEGEVADRSSPAEAGPSPRAPPRAPRRSADHRGSTVREMGLSGLVAYDFMGPETLVHTSLLKCFMSCIWASRSSLSLRSEAAPKRHSTSKDCASTLI